jgi:hypothetical protein
MLCSSSHKTGFGAQSKFMFWSEGKPVHSSYMSEVNAKLSKKTDLFYTEERSITVKHKFPNAQLLTSDATGRMGQMCMTYKSYKDRILSETVYETVMLSPRHQD